MSRPRGWGSATAPTLPEAPLEPGSFLYAPAMVLFSTLSPGAALRALIVFNPALEGLGLYAFLRKVGLARVTATSGALSAAMIVATSWIAISLPFAGTLAWTPVVLLGA